MTQDTESPHTREAAVTICNQRGLHARAAAKFVRTVEAFEAEVSVTKDDVTVPGTSIMGLMMLAAGPGTTLYLQATGADAAAVLDALAALVRRKFDEDA